MSVNYLHKILNARVYDVAHETPLDDMPILSARLKQRVAIKREDLQPIFCYKLRGAYNKINKLSVTERRCGVIAASAGNHAQGVALSAQRLACRAVIVMPVTTPEIKSNAVSRWGAEVILWGDNFDAAYAHAKELAAQQGLVMIPPFDDPDIIVGQGTVGFEMLKQSSSHIDAIFLPVGGGGLISGVAAYVKELRPDIRIIGVEPWDSAAMTESLLAGERVTLNDVGIFADGVAVKQVGEHCFALCERYVDEMVRVTTDEICAAIKDIFEDTRAVVEPSGAVGLAGLKKWSGENPGNDRHLLTVASGANVNFDRLRHVAERSEVGEHREAILAVTIDERPGSFKDFCKVLGNRNISEFNYRYSSHGTAQVFVGVRVADQAETQMLLADLTAEQYQVVNLTDNELAKVHGRYMVGGRAASLANERLFSFEFPERPRALHDFLEKVGDNWNISLFHYRNHGSDFGRVLCGMQVLEQSAGALDQFLGELDYRYQEETHNPVYQLFLR